MRNLALLFLLTASLFSCKKIFHSEYRVTGQVVDKFSGEPIPQSYVELLASGRSGGAFAVVDTISTDHEGKFDFRYHDAKNTLYYIRPAYYELYDNHDAEVDVGPWQKNKKHKLELHPLGWVKVNFVNEPPLDTATISNNLVNAPAFYSIYNDTTLVTQKLANQSHNIVFWIKKHTGEVSISHRIYFEAHDTIEVVLNY